MKFGTLKKFQGLIAAIDFLNHESSKNLELFRCKIILNDGSNLRILEKYHYDELVYYSYYWLTTSNELIIGWDNAPHHRRIESFPHHKHLSGHKKPIASNERNLTAVLSFIAKRLK